MFSNDLIEQAKVLLQRFRARGWRLATAESCTGGLIAGLLTEIPGSSDVVECGYVTYSNASKTRLVGVPAELILAQGAVSEAVARALAEGALAASGADAAMAVTGIAGPGGGSAQKPVGLVHMAAARRDGTTLHEEHRFGDLGRTEIRLATVAAALNLLEAV